MSASNRAGPTAPLFVLLFIALLMVATGPISSIGVSSVAGSGVLLVENPGDAFATPTTASLGLEFRPEQRRFYWGGSVTFAPFLARNEQFRQSVLLLGEGDLGYLLSIIGDEPAVEITGIVSVGGYLRTTTVDGGDTARRPTSGAAVRISTVAQKGWRYTFEIRYRAFFDNTVVHSVQPSVGVGYAFFPREDRS